MSEKLESNSACGRALIEVLVSLSLISIVVPALYSLLQFRFQHLSRIEKAFERVAQRHAFSVATEQVTCSQRSAERLVHWVCRRRNSSRKHFLAYEEHDPA